MALHTITAMFETRAEADRAATSVRENAALGATNVKVLPDGDTEVNGTTATVRHEDTGFLASLRNFFMPEEDRYSYAEGMRRGSYMVAVDTDETHAHQIMDVLEQAGAVDLETQEAQWRQEGWRGYEPSSAATAYGDITPPAAYGETTTPAASGQSTTSDLPATGAASTRAAGTEAVSGAGTEERVPLAEETLRVGKRLVSEGRVRIRGYVVETPVSETVRLRDEHVQVERRPVDRPVTADGDSFRERTLEATETREEPVVSKDARVREELVLHRSADERDETVTDTVRRTEVSEDRDDGTRDPAVTKKA